MAAIAAGRSTASGFRQDYAKHQSAAFGAKLARGASVGNLATSVQDAAMLALRNKDAVLRAQRAESAAEAEAEQAACRLARTKMCKRSRISVRRWAVGYPRRLRGEGGGAPRAPPAPHTCATRPPLISRPRL